MESFFVLFCFLLIFLPGLESTGKYCATSFTPALPGSWGPVMPSHIIRTWFPEIGVSISASRMLAGSGVLNKTEKALDLIAWPWWSLFPGKSCFDLLLVVDVLRLKLLASGNYFSDRWIGCQKRLVSRMLPGWLLCRYEKIQWGLSEGESMALSFRQTPGNPGRY